MVCSNYGKSQARMYRPLILNRKSPVDMLILGWLKFFLTRERMDCILNTLGIAHGKVVSYSDILVNFLLRINDASKTNHLWPYRHPSVSVPSFPMVPR